MPLPPSNAVTQSARQAAAQPPEAEQLAFDFLIPFGPRKTLLTTVEAAECLGLGDDSVRTLVETGELEAHKHNIAGVTNRFTNRVTRRSVALYLLRTADYAPADYAAQLEAFARGLRPEQRGHLLKILNQLAK